MPILHSAHLNLRVDDQQQEPRTVVAHDFHNGGRIPTGDVLLIMDERLGLGITLSGAPDPLIRYLEAGIAAIRATQAPLTEVA